MSVRFQRSAVLLRVPCLARTAGAQDPAARPAVWMAPPGAEDGRGWRGLFAQPERPE